jgi:hypothetical protein
MGMRRVLKEINRRPWTTVLVVLCLLPALIVIVEELWPRPPEEAAINKWNRIQLGMSKTRVLRVMGPPNLALTKEELDQSDRRPSPGTATGLFWTLNGKHHVWVELDADDLVIVKGPYGIEQRLVEKPDWLERLVSGLF